jgi:hypothetical protein
MYCSVGRRGMIASGVAAALALAGCGGSGHQSAATSSTSSSESTTAAASATSSSLDNRVLASNQLPGFTPGAVQRDTTPRSWFVALELPPASSASELAMLHRDGFRAGEREDLTNGGTAALSIARARIGALGLSDAT